jgi:hypothetical protein
VEWNHLKRRMAAAPQTAKACPAYIRGAGGAA